jgi:hypothetical protein
MSQRQKKKNFDFDFIYAGFSPAYSMKPKASSKKEFDFKDFKDLAVSIGKIFPPPPSNVSIASVNTPLITLFSPVFRLARHLL